MVGQAPEQTVVNDLNSALEQFQPQAAITAISASQATFTLQASASTPLSESVALALGLPGLQSLAVTTSNQPVAVQLTFQVDLAFGLNSGSNGFFIDPTQNSASSPLLQLELKASLGPISAPNAKLNGVPVLVTTSSQSPSTLDVPVTFNCSATSEVSGFTEADIDEVNVSSSAAGSINLAYALQVANAPALTLDLGVQWPLSSTVPNTSPLDGVNDGSPPTVTLDAGVDLNSVGNALNTSSPLIQKFDTYVQPLQDVVNFFYQPVPILSNFGKPVTVRDLLALPGILPQSDQGFLSVLDTLHDFINGSSGISLPAGGQVNFVSSQLPSGVDVRSNLGSAALLTAIESQAQQTDVGDIQSYLNELGSDLDGKIVLPLVSDPALAFDALLSNDNVALVQYTLNPVSLPQLANIQLGPELGPIIPPIPLFLKLMANFGFSAGLSLGYDTYGFHGSANPINGHFIANAKAQAIGGISLTGDLDVGLAQAGVTGTLGLSFGVAGLNTMSGYSSHSVESVNGSGDKVSSTVLQLDDFLNDVQMGGTFCPFTIGGTATLSLSAYVQLGPSPFDINESYPLGNITLFDFTVPSCQPQAVPRLGEMFANPDPKNPPIPGLPVATIEKQ